MPLYDYRCRTCGETFEVRRSMAHADEPAACPEGHPDTVKMLPLVAVGRRTSAPAGSAAPAPAGGGGCCGGTCGCG